MSARIGSRRGFDRLTLNGDRSVLAIDSGCDVVLSRGFDRLNPNGSRRSIDAADSRGSLTVSGGRGAMSSLALAIALACSAPAAFAQVMVDVAPATLPVPVVNVPYAASATGSGGRAPYALIGTAGRWPDGVTMTASGAISGTPTASGPFAINLTAIDADGRQATRSYVAEVDAGIPQAVPQIATLLEDGSKLLLLDAVDRNDAALEFALAPGGAPLHGTLQGTMPDVIYVPSPDYNGGDVFLYTASDGENVSEPAQVTLTIVPVNDAPRYVGGDDVVALRNAGAVTLPGWVTVTSLGAPDEAAQNAQFVLLSNTRPALFAAAPVIAPDGTLSFTPSGQAGTAVLSFELRDDGGIANGGIDRSAPQFFTIALQSPGTDLSVAIEASAAFVDNAPLQFTVRVENAGPSPADDASVDVLLPPQLTAAQWTCAAEGAATCTAAGSGDIADSVDIPVNGHLVYTVQATVAANGADAFTVDANVAPGDGAQDPDPSDDADQHVFRADAVFSDGFEE